MASKHLRQLQNISHIRALHALVQGSVPSSNNHLLEGPFCMLSNPTLLHLLWQCRELNQLYGEPPAERTRQAGIPAPIPVNYWLRGITPSTRTHLFKRKNPS